MNDAPSRQRHRCPVCGADLISIDGDPPQPRFAVFACGSSESRIDGDYRFLQTTDCVALAEERAELDLPGPPSGALPGHPLCL
jgi:hypothetical protein